MSQNLEIEFKNMLTEKEFTDMKATFQLTSSDFFTQENHYFDTPDFALKHNGCALRIREKKNGFKLTLKQPHQEGLLETNQILLEETAQDLLHGKTLIDGIVKEQIKNFDINPDHLCYFGSLVTNRCQFPYENGLLVLDYSTYLNVHDYEIEYEVTDYKSGKKTFLHLLSHLKIPIRTSKNKVQRFYEQKEALGFK